MTVTLDTRHATRAVLAGDGGPITAGDAVTLTGVLTSRDGDVLGGQEVRLYARPADTGTWSRIGRSVTDASGVADFNHTPVRSTDYRMRHAATSTTLESDSALWRVDVRFHVTASLSATTVPAGGGARVSGRIVPAAHDGHRVAELYVRTESSGWWWQQDIWYGPDGTFDVDIAESHPGSYQYQVRVREDIANAAGSSDVLNLTVVCDPDGSNC